MQELLSARALSVVKRSDARRIIIRDVSLALYANEIVGIVGESGSGKTTTALALMGMLPPSLVIGGGSVHIQKRELATMSAQERAAFWGKETGFIFQDPSASLNPVQRIGAQIAERLALFSTLSKREREARALCACQEAGLPSSRALLQKYPHELSGGMKQRAMIASAIIHGPSFIIADEPTASLDAATAQEILRLIKRLQEKRGCAVLLISHDLNAVRAICSRVFVMHRGSIIESAASGVFFTRPAAPHAQELVDAARLLSGVEAQSIRGIKEARESVAQKPLVELNAFCASYASRFAPLTHSAARQNALDTNNSVLKNISLSINEGEVFGLLGESGSGKTTLGRALAGIIPYRGVYKAGGIEFSSLSQKERSRFVQIVFQNPAASLNPAMTVQRIVEEPLVIQGAAAKRERVQKAREMLESVQLDRSFLTRFPRELSGGEKQRAAIASALMTSPRLLIADEMLSALDAAVQVKILELLCRLRERFGFAVLFITHNAALAGAFCHRTASMSRRGHLSPLVL